MERKCFNCGIESNEVILLQCEYKEDVIFLCIKCLPSLIQCSH